MDDSRIELRRHTKSSLRFGGEMGMVGGNEGAEARDAPRSSRDPGSVLNVEGGEPLELERVYTSPYVPGP